MKSTSTRYGTVAVTIHWASALLILALLVSGMRAGDMAVEASKT
ncbi:MAG: cytochrome B, partial [Alphaproteobacteria bacterium]|nr:cytochrome B [Alphaproteobacteria bacterium]